MNHNAWLRAASLTALVLCLPVGAVVSIDSLVYLTGPEVARLRFPTATQEYYRVEFASDPAFPTGIVQVRGMRLGTGAMEAWDDTSVVPLPSGYYRLRALDRSAPLDYDNDGTDDVSELLGGRDPLVPDAPGGRLGLVINEVDYDQLNTDTAEFVEIYNSATNAIRLTGISLILVNGAVAPATQYASVDLSSAETLAAGGYLVVAPTGMVITNTATVVRFAGTSNQIQNGAPDGVALLDTVTGVVLDALSYEGSITAATFTGFPGSFNLVEGTPTQAQEDTLNGFVFSLGRKPDGRDTNDASADWALTNAPTPGTANTFDP